MRGQFLLRYLFATHTRYCVVGGGSGGLNLTAHMLRSNVPPSEFRIFQPAKYHYYQPGWTMVGAGLKEIVSTQKLMVDVLPKYVALTQQRVKLIKPEQNKLILQNGEEHTYEELILASGLQLNWGKVQGLLEQLNDEKSNVGSIYQYGYAKKTAKIAQRTTSGKAIFTEPSMPIKCAGAPQKILYLWTSEWQKRKLSIDVEFMKTVGVMFGVPKYSQSLTQVAASYGIKTTFKHNLVKVTAKEATFQNVQTKERITKQFDFLHVTPSMSAHSYIAQSGLADANGYLDLDKFTLRHKKYRNIWGLGDCTSLPNSKTAAAVFSQTEALHDNLVAIRKNPTETNLPGKYEGYASCPLFVGKNKLMLAQFKYDGVIDETFFNDQQKPRESFYWMKRFMFPLAYWNFVPRGLWAGRKGIRWS